MVLHPSFPVIEGRYQMTLAWTVTLPRPFNQRFERGSLVIWRPGFTLWTNVWGNNLLESQRQRLEWLRSETALEAWDIAIETDSKITRYAYRLTEIEDNRAVHALYAYAIGTSGHVQMGIYFDNEDDIKVAKQIWMSLDETQSR